MVWSRSNLPSGLAMGGASQNSGLAPRRETDNGAILTSIPRTEVLQEKRVTGAEPMEQVELVGPEWLPS